MRWCFDLSRWAGKRVGDSPCQTRPKQSSTRWPRVILQGEGRGSERSLQVKTRSLSSSWASRETESIAATAAYKVCNRWPHWCTPVDCFLCLCRLHVLVKAVCRQVAEVERTRQTVPVFAAWRVI